MCENCKQIGTRTVEIGGERLTARVFEAVYPAETELTVCPRSYAWMKYGGADWSQLDPVNMFSNRRIKVNGGANA